jgi:hypothetical protein
VRSHQEDTSPFVDKRIEQEEDDGPSSNVVHLRPSSRPHPKDDHLDAGIPRAQPADELSDTSRETEARQEMTGPPSRQEIDAKLEAAEARTEARFTLLTGTLDVRFANLDNKVDRLVDTIGHLAGEISEIRRDVSVAPAPPCGGWAGEDDGGL